MEMRRYDRTEVLKKVKWDLFTASTGAKRGYVANISQGGCLIKTNELAEHRRWIRMVIEDDESNLGVALVGRVVRCENKLEAFPEGDMVLYRYGIEFTYPAGTLANVEPIRPVLEGTGRCAQAPAVPYDFDLILALSSRKLNVRSCLNRNSMSSDRSGFLA